MPLQCLVFDCDGVILDSVPVKTRAFARLAEPFGPEARDRFVMYHTVHGGVSRYKKFEWFFREVLGREISQEESTQWGRRFAEYALDEVRRCPLIPGVRDVLESWHGRLPLYVCSGAPEEELRLVLHERRLEGRYSRFAARQGPIAGRNRAQRRGGVRKRPDGGRRRDGPRRGGTGGHLVLRGRAGAQGRPLPLGRGSHRAQ